MARYSMGYTTKTMVATNDAANMTDNGYAGFILGGTNSQLLKFNEVYVGGEDTASTPTTMVFGRDSTIAATGISGNFLAPTDVTSTTLGSGVPVYGCVSTTKPQRSNSLGRLLGLSLNTYGGIARWQARYGEEITSYGTAVSVGEVSLSSVTGTGKVSGHILFEAS